MRRGAEAPVSTPIRRQYLDIKRRYPHAVVFFRLGDFYETFDDDARLCARELDITLTSKPMGKNLRVPLAGIPHHALDSYLARLIAKGYKVAICEQMEEAGPGKGLVDRQVVRVVTPGTVLEGSLLDERANNYLAALAFAPEAPARRAGRTTAGRPAVGVAYVDVSTGEFAAAEVSMTQLAAELARLRPAELLLAEGIEAPAGLETPVTRLDPYWFDPEEADRLLREHFQVASLEAFGLRDQPRAVAAAGAVLRYVQENQRASLPTITALHTYNPTAHMILDAQTRRNLELFAGGREGRREGSLLAVLDQTRTALGARLLRRWLGQPVLDIISLHERQGLVTSFFEDGLRRGSLREALGGVPDLERLVGRIGAGIASPREVVALRRGLEAVEGVRQVLAGEGAAASEGLPADEADLSGREASSPAARLLSRLRPCEDVSRLIADAIADEPGATLEQGEVVRSGFSPELDQLRSLTRDVRRYLAEMETQEKARTGIKSLKVGYNKVFGYYIEVSRPNLGLVPDDYQRRQTLVNAERFITGQLKEYESQILNARERIAELESAIFRQVCAQVAAAADRVLTLAAAVAEADTASALAEAAVRYHYVCPQLTEDDEIVIKDGRHPAVERALGEGEFVPNDTYLSNGDSQIVVLTGPNMAGKSTYLRQVALIVLLAQVGSYVPAYSARVGLVDRIFTRVGAQEDLARGESTFMVEMLETASILHNATPRSLVILDEIGRGTSTYDGLAIARAVVEYLHSHAERAAKTLFATHYHELVELASFLPRVKNSNVAVTEEGGRVVFLRKIVPGGSDRSYGIHVAELAGLPRAVVQRAAEVLSSLEATHDGRTAFAGRGRSRRRSPAEQLPLLGPRPPLLEELAALDVDSLTPLQAITKLYELKEQAKDG
jgi:DNA mismatch repair protein MutS